jgi:hypothetical protein
MKKISIFVKEQTLQRFVMGGKELAHTLIDKIPDNKVVEVVDFILFIYGKNKNEFDDLLSVSERTLDFWNNEEDEVWNNYSYCHNI